VKSFQFILAILLLQGPFLFAEGYAIPVRGLPNLGSSCYVNSVLQCLFQIPEFAQLIREETFYACPFLDGCKSVADVLDTNNDEEILESIAQLFDQTAGCLFDGSCEQQDVLDLLLYVISSIPELQSQFCLLVNTKISCIECGTLLKSASHTAYDLPLDTLAPQIIDGINCPECQISQIKACKKSEINNFPKYILINCDQLCGRNGTTALKNLQDIQSKLFDYELIGAILYVGNKKNGHYIAQIRENFTKKWYLCNDMHVVKFENIATEKQKSGILHTKNHVAFLPRILFYSKKQQKRTTKVSI